MKLRHLVLFGFGKTSKPSGDRHAFRQQSDCCTSLSWLREEGRVQLPAQGRLRAANCTVLGEQAVHHPVEPVRPSAHTIVHLQACCPPASPRVLDLLSLIIAGQAYVT